MFAVLGILVSLALLITLAYRGWNVILLAPICALVAAILSIGDETPLLATYTQVFMPALGNYLLKFFPLFLLGAVFGKLMDDSGCARAIAHQVVVWTGKERAILAIVLACGILTYGGVSLFVVAFAVFPIALRTVPRGRHPEAPDPGRDCARFVHLHDDGPAGHARDPERDPSPVLRHQHLRRSRPRMIAALIMFGGGMLWLSLRSRRLRAAGEGFGEGCDRRARAPSSRAEAGDVPPFWSRSFRSSSLATNFVFTNYSDRRWTRLPRDAKYGTTSTASVRASGRSSSRWSSHRGADRAQLAALRQPAALAQRRYAGLDAADLQRRLGGRLRRRDRGPCRVHDHPRLAAKSRPERPGDLARADRQRARRASPARPPAA